MTDPASEAPTSVLGQEDRAAVPVARVVDEVPVRLRHPRDVLAVVLSVVGIVLVLALSVYAHGTTSGLASDVREFSTLLGKLLVLPVALLEAAIMLGIPTAVLIELGVRRLGRMVLDSLVAGAVGLGLGIVMTWAIHEWGSTAMLEGLSVRSSSGALTLTIPVYVAGIVALLTLAGPASRRRTVRWSWNLLWFSLAVVLILGQVAIPGVLLTLLLGRLAGALVRYAFGVRSERAVGTEMVEALRHIGFDPLTLVRVRDVAADEADEVPESAGPSIAVAPDTAPTADVVPAGASTDIVSDERAMPSTRAITAAAQDPASITITRYSDNRVYALNLVDGPRLDVVVLDGDRQVIGVLTRLWRSIRLRGIEGRSGVSLRAVAERTALLAYAAQAAGVRTPRLRGVTEASDSMLLVQEHVAGAMSLRDLPDDALTDAVLVETWRQLGLAHAHGLAHRGLTADVVLVHRGARAEGGGGPTTASSAEVTAADEDLVWLTGWEQGDVASSEFSRHMDVAQMLALLALRVGAERAIASAATAGLDLATVGPLLQTPTLPRDTREQLRAHKEVLPALREALVARMPEASVEPLQVRRFRPRTIIMTTLTVVAAVVIITTVNFAQIRDAVVSANLWWMLIAFGFGLLTWMGAALAFVAFAPVKVPFNRAVLAQAASSFVALAAPAGIGPAALNMRMLTKRNVATTLSVATVALVQLSQMVVTVVLLVVLSVTTGDGSVLRSLPSTPVLVALGGVALAVALSLTVPTVRRWLLRKLKPTVDQVWPRLSSVLGQPSRLLLGIAGNVVMSLAYVLAFDAALVAFGQHISLIDAAVIYLVGNAVGAAVPTPGGIGAIEFALITGLTTTAGIVTPLATSAVVLFRLVTYWARIPLGWVAMQYLQRRDEL